MSALRELLVHFGFSMDRAQLSGVQSTVQRLTAGARTLGMAIGGVAMVRSARSFVTSLITTGDALHHLSARTGISVSQLQALRLGAERAGVDASGMAVGLRTLAVRMYDAGTGAGEARDLFRQLGVEVRDANGGLRPTSDILPDIADAMQRLPGRTERTAIAMALFGRQGGALSAVLGRGRDGIADLQEELERLGGGFSEDAATSAGEADEAIRDFRVTVMSLRSTIATEILPTVARWLEALSRLAADFARGGNAMAVFRTAAVALGTVLVAAGVQATIAWGAAILPILAAAAAVAALYLVANDLQVALNGGDSALQRMLESLVGVEKAAEWMTWLRDTWRDIRQNLQASRAAVRGFLGLRYDATNDPFADPERQTELADTYRQYRQQSSHQYHRESTGFAGMLWGLPGLSAIENARFARQHAAGQAATQAQATTRATEASANAEMMQMLGIGPSNAQLFGRGYAPMGQMSVPERGDVGPRQIDARRTVHANIHIHEATNMPLVRRTVEDVLESRDAEAAMEQGVAIGEEF